MSLIKSNNILVVLAILTTSLGANAPTPFFVVQLDWVRFTNLAYASISTANVLFQIHDQFWVPRRKYIHIYIFL